MVKNLLLACSNADDTPEAVARLGGKAANLLALQRIGVPVPPFYVIATDAFQRAIGDAGLQTSIERRLSGMEDATDRELCQRAGEIAAWVHSLSLPAELIDEIAGHPWTVQQVTLAVRSSVAGEDAAAHSFAGVHESVLAVRGLAALEAAIKQVWASAFREQALAYRRRMDIPLHPILPAVIVQQMIQPHVSGVMFTANPVTGNFHELMVNSLYGAGEGLVTAGLDADRYVLDRESRVIRAEIASKREQLIMDDCNGNRLHRVPLAPSLSETSSLSQVPVEDLVRAGVSIERHFGRPQDIEFVCDATGQLYFLQARPVTTITEYGPAAGHRQIWDNSNIIESYFGATSPMTFSFIRRAYSIVYRCFMDVMGVSPELVERHQDTFRNMLGFFRGRVYYNLLNWFRLLRLLPGYRFNRQFMESMMGLKQPVLLDDEGDEPGLLRRYFVELPALGRVLLRSLRNFLRIRRTVREFSEHFDARYHQWSKIDFRTKAPHEIMALYREMERALLWNWKAPIINDFYVMVFCGALRKLCAAWCGDTTGSLANDLLCGQGGIVSAEPVKMLLALARMAGDSPDLKHKLLTADLDQLACEIPSDSRFSDFSAALERYLELYGARRMNELKLEEYSLRDKPVYVYQIIRNYLAAESQRVLDPACTSDRERDIREKAEARAFKALQRSRGSGWKIWAFRRVLYNSRFGITSREQMRFARTLVYDLLRRMIRSIAAHWTAAGILSEPDDIFYLTLDEVWDFIQGTAVTTEMQRLAALRKSEFAQYAKDSVAPDSRFETYGMAYHRNQFRNWRRDSSPASVKGVLYGTPCSSGEATGTIKVMNAPSFDQKVDGEILVAERTDPGWVHHYPTISGILIERGSVLSHSAIVAREMGIPTIVGIQGLLARLRTGDRVRMNGATGDVHILSCVRPL